MYLSESKEKEGWLNAEGDERSEDDECCDDVEPASVVVLEVNQESNAGNQHQPEKKRGLERNVI